MYNWQMSSFGLILGQTKDESTDIKPTSNH